MYNYIQILSLHNGTGSLFVFLWNLIRIQDGKIWATKKGKKLMFFKELDVFCGLGASPEALKSFFR
jgi:hypothetical protein